MYCSHCGKEISAQAIMCPFCGEPTKNAPIKTAEPEVTTSVQGDKVTGLSIIGLILAMFAFVTGIIFGAFFYCFSSSVVLIYIIGATTILPGLAGLSLGAYVHNVSGKTNGTAKLCAVTAIVLSVIVLLFLFITASIFGANY